MSEPQAPATCRRPPWQAIASDLLAERNVKIEKGRRYGTHARHLLDIYEPTTAETNGPIVVFLYGGAWRTGERGCYSFVGSALASRGITTVIPDYRLYPDAHYPDFNVDAAQAYAWVQHNLNNTGNRPVILMGHSAGAHIATTIAYDRSYLTRATANQSHRPDGVIAMSGPYSFHPTTWPTTKEIFATAPDPETPRPVTHVGPHCPPTLLIYGLKDDVIEPENAHELRDALASAGVEVELIEYPRIGHVLPVTSFLRVLRWRAPVMRDCIQFICELAETDRKTRTAIPATTA